MQRLKTRAQFQAVLAGSTLARTTHFALHGLPIAAAAYPPGSAHAPTLFPVQAAWLGAMVPKRWAKRAVTRNAIKRQIYSVGVQSEPLLRPWAHVVRLRCSFDKAQFVSASSQALKQQVRAELLQLFARASVTPADALPASLPRG